MRRRRYLLLGLALAATLALLGLLAARQFRSIARGRAEGLARTIADRLDAAREHARWLAGRDVETIAGYLSWFEGLARVRIHDADGRTLHHVERFEHTVARLRDERAASRASDPPPPPPPPGRVVSSGFRRDAERLDVHPDLRVVVDHRVRRPDGGQLVLTLYAEPFLRPLRRQGGALVDAQGRTLFGPPGDGARVVVAGPGGWRVALPVGPGAGELALLGVAALAVLLLGAATIVLSERQIRAAERAAVERRLARTERLSAIGLLASGIAHEINNPLEGIANWLRLGEVERAREGFERIRAIVRDLLAFARPDASDDTADLAECFARAHDLARYAEAFRGVEVEGTVPAGLRVRGSARPIEQVILNVLLNAGAAMRGGGARRVDLAVAHDDARVELSIRDHGTGIAPDVLPHLFDPFFSRHGGSGLGLSVSYGLIRAVDGDLRAANAPGGGAVFTLELARA